MGRETSVPLGTGGRGWAGLALPRWVPPPPASTAARQAAVLFTLSGAALLISHGILGSPMPSDGIVRALYAASVLYGVLVWLLPWHRWHPLALLVNPVVAFGLIAAGNSVQQAPYEYGVFFVVVFGWAGLSQGRWMCAALSPLAALAYLGPLLLFADPGPGAIASTFTVIPVGVLIGETIAAKVAQLTVARSASEHTSTLLRAVTNAGRVINTLDRPAVLSAVSQALADLGFTASSFTILNDDRTHYRVEEARGLPPEYALGTHLADGTLTGLVRDCGATVTTDDYSGQYIHPALQSDRFGGVIATPLWVSGVLVGSLIAGKPERDTFAAEDREALELLARQAGRALENVGTFQAEVAVSHQLADDSRRDVLTGLGNRRHAMTLLDEVRPGDVVALIDLDHFKAVNDTYGHAAGDAVLHEFGVFLNRRIREGDDVARYGGEEFLLVLRGAGSEVPLILARLAADWRRLGRATTFSTGYAVHALGALPAATLGNADDALYAAKAAGRDCIRPG